ncbi:HNH endonuclease [Bdellovibrio bacteriovorus]|uniref:HNH endonuclease n=1 Tax=Bdellovibrio TaxID=958 RepID=UPI0035A84E67
MNVKQLSNDELILRMEKLVRTERKITHLILLHIAEIEDRKIFAEMGYDGMYSYLTRGLGYSEGAAYRRLQSARLLRQVPSVAEKIEEGSLNLTQLTQVQKCVKENIKNGENISVEKTIEILAKLENKNSFETQKTLAVEMNLPVQTQEKLKPQADDSFRVEMTLTAEQFVELEKARNLLSHVCPGGSWAEVISILAKNFNQRKLDGKSNKLKKSTQLVIATKNIGVTPDLKSNLSSNTLSQQRKYISLHTRRALLNKAHHRCEYQDPKNGKKCSSGYLLEIDHIRPVALGGTNEISNLRVLCRAHNALAARKLGLAFG